MIISTEDLVGAFLCVVKDGALLGACMSVNTETKIATRIANKITGWYLAHPTEADADKGHAWPTEAIASEFDPPIEWDSQGNPIFLMEDVSYDALTYDPTREIPAHVLELLQQVAMPLIPPIPPCAP